MSKTTYIETELGLLPSDWKIRTLGEVAPLQRGFDLPASELKKGPYPVVYSNGILNYHHIGPCVAPGLVTGRSGTIGKFTYISKGRYWPHNTALWVTSFKDNCPLFVRYLFETVNFGAYSTGTGVPTLNRNDLHTCTVSLPPTKAEQTAIAEALSDIDSLIRNFDRTIAKKQNIRQGAMEQLLSGQLRLPGFKKKWIESELGNICRTMKRGTMLTSNNFVKGTIPVIAAGIEPAGYHNVANRPPMTITVSSSGANAGYVAFHKDSIFAGDCFTIEKSEEYDVEFIYYSLKSKQKEIFKLQTGGAQPHVHPKDIAPLSIMYPTDLKEQQAIADTLTAMDDEIAMLQLERDKYANIRAGMMDELLSGKKRLI